jgi:hypothetical protein
MMEATPENPRAEHRALAERFRGGRRGRARLMTPPASGTIDARAPSRREAGPAIALDPAAPAAETDAALTQANHGICTRCDRRVCRPGRPEVAGRPEIAQTAEVAGARLLAEIDWCRWCARPISERGEREAPTEGFLDMILDAQRELAAPTSAASGAP